MRVGIGKIRRVYFIGIGGIGMSALARYFAHQGLMVAGYDSTPTPLTNQLKQEGITVDFKDTLESIPKEFIEIPEESLIIFTPAIPSNHCQYNYFKNNNYLILKRAQALGLISRGYETAAVAGTHGKTSTSTLLAHLLASTRQGCNAFLGGISKNFESNLVLADRGASRLVVEADEFDRSFLNLNPQLAIITSTDADHLDIYKTHSEVKEAFSSFISNITPGGVLIIKKGLEKIAKSKTDIKIYTYSAVEKADFFLQNISNVEGVYTFDLVTPFGNIEKITLGAIGKYNVENAIAASAAALIWGMETDELEEELKTFKGIARRFDLKHLGKTVYIDDYAHHPEEIKAAIGSIREMFPNRKVTGIFQPHLFSRTNDFAKEFADSLSNLDELILLDIYPAREKPMPGITSEMIFNQVQCSKKQLCSLANLQDLLKTIDIDVLLTMGAGNIDGEVPKITKMLKEKEDV